MFVVRLLHFRVDAICDSMLCDCVCFCRCYSTVLRRLLCPIYWARPFFFFVRFHSIIYIKMDEWKTWARPQTLQERTQRPKMKKTEKKRKTERNEGNKKAIGYRLWRLKRQANREYWMWTICTMEAHTEPVLWKSIWTLAKIECMQYFRMINSRDCDFSNDRCFSLCGIVRERDAGRDVCTFFGFHIASQVSRNYHVLPATKRI